MSINRVSHFYKKNVMILLGWSVLAGLLGCMTTQSLSPAQIEAILAAPDRSAADRTTDVKRKAPQMLAFLDVQPGMQVLELGAGGGYTAELLARLVGPKGHVVAQNTQTTMQNNVKDRFAQRMALYSQKNLSLNVRPFDAPLTETQGKGTFDRVTFLFSYHDLGGAGINRAHVNQAVFAALKSGGIYVVADHSGRAHTGVSESKTLHRIDQALVREEVESAGFLWVAEADFLRNPLDPRDIPVFKSQQPNDEFVMKFKKP